MWSEMLMTSFMSCSISSTVTLCWSLSTRISALRSSVSRGLRPAAGSVEHQDARAGHHAAGDFQATLLTVGQGAGRAVGKLGQVDLVQPIRGELHGVAFTFAKRRGLQQARQVVGVEVAM